MLKKIKERHVNYKLSYLFSNIKIKRANNNVLRNGGRTQVFKQVPTKPRNFHFSLADLIECF